MTMGFDFVVSSVFGLRTRCTCAGVAAAGPGARTGVAAAGASGWKLVTCEVQDIEQQGVVIEQQRNQNNHGYVEFTP